MHDEDEVKINDESPFDDEDTIVQPNDTTTTEEQPPIVEETKNSSISADLIRGHINTIILRTLYDEDKYGYQIMQEIEEKSHGQYILKQPTLYSALKRLESQGYIKSYWRAEDVTSGGRRKYFTLTESGKNIIEINLAEWEYSRTVIDSLISDNTYDLSKPAPTAVDFRILKNSTSRVPYVKTNDEDDTTIVENEPPKIDLPPNAHVFTDEQLEEERARIAQEERLRLEAEFLERERLMAEEYARQQAIEEENKRLAAEEAEKRRIAHENYLKLISAPKPEAEPHQPELPHAPAAPIYNDQPEAVRDYRNLVDAIYIRTLSNTAPLTHQTHSTPTEVQLPSAASYPSTNVDLQHKAQDDGLKINIPEIVSEVKPLKHTGFERTKTLFKCSMVAFVLFFIDAMLCLIFSEQLGVTYVYPVVIGLIGVIQLLVFSLIMMLKIGYSTRKPLSKMYISASIVFTLLLILVICIVALVSKIDFNNLSMILTNMVIPCATALIIPIFSITYNLLSK